MTPAVERIVIVATDGWAGQGGLAYWDLPEGAGCAFLLYSA